MADLLRRIRADVDASQLMQEQLRVPQHGVLGVSIVFHAVSARFR